MLYLQYECRCDAEGCEVIATSAWQLCRFPALWDRYVLHVDEVPWWPVLPKGWTLHGIAAYCPKHLVTVTVEDVDA